MTHSDTDPRGLYFSGIRSTGFTSMSPALAEVRPNIGQIREVVSFEYKVRGWVAIATDFGLTPWFVIS